MNRGLNRFAIFVACATFFLIIAGALVTSNDAGLATPDWPLSNGQVFPKMVGNLFWEHGHRMVATTVGMLTIVLTIYILLKEKRPWVRKLGMFALLAVIAQGLLGGLTVKLMLPLAVSSAHATLAQLFFCTTVSLAVFTSRSWIEAKPLVEEKGNLPLRYLCTGALVTIGKAYNGLTDAEIREMTERLVTLTVEDHGHHRTVRPEIVLEVAFNHLQRSARHTSGYALRFPRIVRVRADRSPADASTLADVERLAATLAPATPDPDAGAGESS